MANSTLFQSAYFYHSLCCSGIAPQKRRSGFISDDQVERTGNRFRSCQRRRQLRLLQAAEQAVEQLLGYRVALDHREAIHGAQRRHVQANGQAAGKWDRNFLQRREIRSNEKPCLLRQLAGDNRCSSAGRRGQLLSRWNRQGWRALLLWQHHGQRNCRRGVCQMSGGSRRQQPAAAQMECQRRSKGPGKPLRPQSKSLCSIA